METSKLTSEQKEKAITVILYNNLTEKQRDNTFLNNLELLSTDNLQKIRVILGLDKTASLIEIDNAFDLLY